MRRVRCCEARTGAAAPAGVLRASLTGGCAVACCLGSRLALAADPRAVSAASAGSPAHALTRGTLDGDQAADYASGLLLVFALLGLLMWAARWMQKRNGFGRGGMRVLSSMALGGKERLMVVDVDGERLLIGVAPGGVQLIRALGEADHEPGAVAPAPRSWLLRTLGREEAR